MNRENYFIWQQKLKENSGFKKLWSFWGIYSVLLFEIWFVYLLIIKEFSILVLGTITFIFARFILAEIIHLFIKVPRPYQVLNFIPISSKLFFTYPHSRLNSFPSEHALSLAALTSVMFWFFPVWGAIALIFIVLNGIGRVILGYHFFKDILWGWGLGFVCGISFIIINNLFFT